jgi:TolA-binding protein
MSLRTLLRYATDKSKIPAFLTEQGECEVKGGLLEQALQTYDGIASRYPNSQWSAKAAVARAAIYRELGRLDLAAAEADRVIGEDHAGDAKYEAILFKADCLVDLGRLDDAFETYDLVEETWKPGHAQEAYFNMGEINFYEGDFGGAESYYNVTLRQFYDEPRANDAAERILLLKASKSGEAYAPELEDLAHAVLLKRQGKIGDAQVILDRLARGTGEIRVESLQNLSEMYLEQGAFERAAATYKVIGESLDTRRSPAALEAAGDIYLNLGRTDEAVKVYENVILRFPDSVAAGEARRKIELSRRQGSGES